MKGEPLSKADIAEEAAFARRERFEQKKREQRAELENRALRSEIEDAVRRMDESLIVRGARGRPGWSGVLFGRRWRRALRQGNLPPDAPLAAVAPYFEALDGTRGTLSFNQLRKLRQRWEAGALPEIKGVPEGD